MYQKYYFCCEVLCLILIHFCDSQKYKGLLKETQLD